MTSYRISSLSNTHISIDGVREPKNLIRYGAVGDGLLLYVGDQKKWPRKPELQPVLPANIFNGDNGNAPFADYEEFDAYMIALLNSGSNGSTVSQIAVSLDANYIENDVFIGRTVASVIINDMVKNTGFAVVEGSTPGKINRLQFTDDPVTTVSVGQQVTITFAS